MSWIANAWRSLREPRIASEEITLSPDTTCLNIQGPPSVAARFTWTDINKAIAFKRDCYAVDQINLAFERADGHCYCVNENMQGWNKLVAILPAVLPGAREYENDWFHEVAQPPFAVSRTVVFTRSVVVASA